MPSAERRIPAVVSASIVWIFLQPLQRDRQSVTDALEELCRREICIRHPDVRGRIAADRLSIEICDRFWPYEKPPVEEFGIDQNRIFRGSGRCYRALPA